MKLSKKLMYELKYLGVNQDKRLDYYIKRLITEKTNFDMEDIELIEVAKLDMKKENEFNYFDFLYKDKRYILKNDNLKCYNDNRKECVVKMALIKCSECGKEISDKASSCPNCGCPIEIDKGKAKDKKRQKKTKNIIFIIIVVIIIIFVFLFIYNFKDLVNKDNNSQNVVEKYDAEEILLCNYSIFNTQLKFYFGNGKILKFVDYSIETYDTEEKAKDRYELIKDGWNDKGASNEVMINGVKVVSNLTLDFQENPKLFDYYSLFDNKKIKITSTIEEVKEAMGQKDDIDNYWTCTILNADNDSNSEEISQTIIQEQKDNITSNNNSNSNNNPSNTTTQKVCNESAKQQLTNEYQTTLQQRENEYQANLSKAQQEVAFAKESLDLTGGYLSSEEYDTLYNQAKSDTYRKLLKNRYNMSITYDKMVNTLNAIPTAYNNWKNTYNAWYQEELNKLGC